MLANLLVFFLSSLFFTAASAEVADESKHCAPHCCGCDPSRGAKKVETLWGLWMSYLKSDPQNFDSALSQFTPTASFYIFGESCDNRDCCQQVYNPATGLDWFYERNITTVDFDLNTKLNGTIITENTLFASIQNVSTIAYHFKMWWNPQINCDYKIDYIEAHSYSCPFSNYTLCDSCQE